jgi:hypothetical protein
MSVLWSGALLVPVIAMCARLAPKNRRGREMAGWVALASLHHRYSAASDTALDEDLRACRDEDPIGVLRRNLKTRYRRLKAEPSDFGGKLTDRSALFAAWVACKHRGVSDILTGTKLILQKGIDRHHILPRGRFELGERPKADTIANIAFVSASNNRSIGDDDPARYLATVKAPVRRSQCVPEQSELWDVDRCEDFWEERRELLAAAFNDYLDDAFGERRG